MANNYYKWGPNSGNHIRLLNLGNQATALVPPYGRFCFTGNYLDGPPAITAHNWRGVVMRRGTADTVQSKVTVLFAFISITTQAATDAYHSVLARVGCILPARDTLDQRIIRDVLSRMGRFIDVQGGYLHGTPYNTSQAA